jgi:3-phenylpropionate/trans-cinnamate dioxygenase ferredoxin reductase subunit
MPDTETHVIVGGGLAGAKAAEALRTEGFDGRLVLVGDESELPYERPPLSKEYLRGESTRADAHVHPAEWYSDNAVELRTGAAAERIDTAARAVELAGGERLHYDKLLLATGAEPRRLTIPGSDLEGIHYLRDADDSDAIAARIGQGGRLVVIGAGWIGAEVAASARQKGAEVAIVEVADVPLERVLGRKLGEIYADVHRAQGVELHLGVGIDSFEGSNRVERVRLSDGRALDADFVVVGIGVVPRTTLAEQAGIAVENGVVVGPSLETSVAGVFAVGDMANAFHPFYDRHMRVEHWANALHQPETAARAMLGKSATYERLPYFFSDQYDVGMEYTGFASAWDEVVFRGDVAAREFIAFWLSDGRVVAAMNVNVWDVTEPLEALIRSRRRVPAETLRDPDTVLEEIVAAGTKA